jgi:hypothetical protein
MTDNDFTLDGSTATYILPPTQGDIQGTYTGTFVFRCFLDPIRQLQAGREYREYLGKHAVLATEVDDNLSFALSQLKHRILKAPPFWTSTIQDSGIAGNLPDLNIIVLILQAAMRAENLYKEKMVELRESILDRTIKVAEDKAKEE